MDILGKRRIWYTISLIILITGLFFLVFKGLNLGIDFQGGTLLEFKFDHEVSNNEVRKILNDTGVAKDKFGNLEAYKEMQKPHNAIH